MFTLWKLANVNNQGFLIFEGLVALKNKVQPCKLEDIIVLIKRFMNQAASDLATRREFLGVVQNKSFL